MNNQEPINFNKQRNFYELYNDAFQLLKKNFKSFTLLVLFIPGPMLILAGSINGYVENLGIDLNFLLNPENKDAAMQKFNELLPYFIPLVVISFLVAVFYSAAVNRYMLLYQQADNESISVKELLHYMPKDCWRLFYNYLLFTLSSFIVLIPILIILSLVPVLFLLLFGAVIFAGPLIYFCVKNASYLVLKDEIPMPYAFIIIFKKAKKKWWLIWGIVVSSLFFIGLLSMIFTLPQLVYNSLLAFSGINPNLAFLAENSKIWHMVFGVIAMLGQYTLLPFLNILFALGLYSVYYQEENLF
jgi:hypothetical protein